MAKAAKKETALTPEEKLEHALVSNTEYPFKIPANWCWTKVGVFSSLYRGVSYKKNDAHSEKHENDCLVLRGGNIGEGFIDTESDNVYVDMSFVNKNQLVRKNDIIVVASTGSTKVIGRAGISEADFSDVAFGAFLILVRPNESTVPKYMGLFFQSDLYRNRIRNSVSGININNIRSEYITESPYPFPPLAEQQRIVDRIESLFTKLDEAKEKAQAVVDGFEDRRAAILYQAFTGILTRTWANKLGIPETSWSKKRFDEVAVIKSNLVDPEEFQNFPHIAPDNIEKKTGRLLEYHTIAEDGMKSGKHRFYPGQILYSKIRPNLSKVVIVDFDGLCSADMYPIESKEGINTKYLWYYMLSEEFLLQASTAGSRSVLPKINQKELSRLTVRVTDPLEQEKIVTTLDQLFEKEQQIKDNAEQSLEQIEGIKKAILARAFRGELGTNDPNDESALELLKKVLSMEPTPQPRKKGFSIPKDMAGELKTNLEKQIVKLFLQKSTDTLAIKEIMNVSSKTFEVLDALRDLEKRKIVKKNQGSIITYTLLR